jgi:hypothetical protein
MGPDRRTVKEIGPMTSTASLTWSDVCARRLERHGLSSPARGPAGDSGPPDAADVAAAICGAHAQVLSAAELSIALRLPAGTRTTVREALWSERSLVKTRGPRGTVHLLAARDLPMWTGALSALPRGRSPFPDDVRMTDEQVERVIEAIDVVLADAELTVDELTEALMDVAGPWAGDRVMDAFQDKWPRWRQIEHLAAYRGVLCYGPDRARRATYTGPRRWLPGFRPADPEDALAELLRRYLHAYGPARPQHVAQWLAVPRTWAMELFERAAGQLERVTVDGVPAWTVAGDTGAPSAPPTGVRLLPYFDAYTVGCHPRELVFPGPAAERALAGGQGGNYPVLLIDGVAAGVWHQRRSGRTLHITVEPLGDLGAARRRELENQVRRTGEILEGNATLTVGPVSVGPHA